MDLFLKFKLIKSYFARSNFFKNNYIVEINLINIFISPLILGIFFGKTIGSDYFIYISILFPIGIFSLLLSFLYSDYEHYKLLQKLEDNVKFTEDFIKRLKEKKSKTFEKYRESNFMFQDSFSILFFLQGVGCLGYIVISKLLN